MVDLVRGLLPRWAEIAAGVGSWPDRCLREGLAWRAIRRLSKEGRDRGDRPVGAYASGIRAALPNAKIAVDRWHLVALANQMVTDVRQRLTRELLGRRGTVADPVWVNRRLLLTGAEHLSAKQWRRLTHMLDDHDPTNEIGAAWGVKERLRLLLKEREPSKIRRRLADFYDAALDAAMPTTMNP